MKKLLTISDFNVSNFNSILCSNEEEPAVTPVEVSYGQVHQLLGDAGAGCWREPPDAVAVWTQPQSVIPSFNSALAHEDYKQEMVLEEVDRFAELLLSVKDRTPAVFVPSWVLPAYFRGLGLLDLRHDVGIANLLMRMNLRLSEKLAGEPNFYIFNAQRWMELAGGRAFNPKLWYMAKVPFGNDVFKEAARDLKAALRAIGGQAKKLVVVDLDDTLWGGIVGDMGWENLTLGGHDPAGEAYADFQKELKILTRRGIVLGIVSKNDESVALDAIRRHPEMVLKENDFSGWRINWSDKARNIVQLVADLNLGLQSVVFIDDNPAERARVREQCPEILVPEWPKDPMLYRKALLDLNCFDSPAIVREDQQRTGMYVAERERKRLHTEVGSVQEWLKSLQIRIEVEPLLSSNLTRTAQLLNKTNQMNLSTRRLSEKELLEWTEKAENQFFTLRCSDRFGDAGLTGLVSFRQEKTTLKLVDFILSCRVFGRQIEHLMLSLAIQEAKRLGCTSVVATYLPTAKNKPCLEFFDQSGMTKDEDETGYLWDVNRDFPLPDHLHVEILPQQKQA